MIKTIYFELEFSDEVTDNQIKEFIEFNIGCGKEISDTNPLKHKALQIECVEVE